jgi:hypothetical protein
LETKKNNIAKLQKTDGTVTEDIDEIKMMTTDFFKTLYNKDDNVEPDEVLHLFQHKISDDMNNELCKDFIVEETGDALFQIGPMKAPGTDGYPAKKIQRNWDLLREEIIGAVTEFFRTRIMPEGLNDAAIVLIPKTKDASNLKDYIPISLCNVVYKIISRCIVNRLCPMLDEIISPTQSAFIPGRMITDNALIAFECIYAIQKNTAKRGKYCAYKLDLAKAYDGVDWTFLEGALRKLGFGERWIQWIMACVTSVRYAVRLNGCLLDSFQPTRGLRQGDSLSSYLFLLVPECLSNPMEKEIIANNIRDLKICRRAPGISHSTFCRR